MNDMILNTLSFSNEMAVTNGDACFLDDVE